MTSQSIKTKRTKGAGSSLREDAEVAEVALGRSGESMSAEELKKVVLEALAEGKDILLDLDQVNHLDASLLQILLALNVEQTKRGRDLQLANASQLLRQWFEFAGATSDFFPAPTEQQ
jgi:anti-anti-sigma factor